MQLKNSNEVRIKELNYISDGMKKASPNNLRNKTAGK